MKRTIVLIIALLVLSFFSVAFAETTGNVNLFLGQKHLDKDDWEPTEDQGEGGIEFDIADKSWPISIAVDMLGSSDEEKVGGLKLTGSTSEFNLGVKKIFSVDSIHPFVGGGISFMNAKFEVDGVSIDGNGTGFWLAGGDHFGLLLGYHW